MDKAKIQHEIKQKKRIVTVIGTIEDVRILGEGGNGLVYKGKLYGIDVAVKLLVNTDHKKRERFLAEYFNIQATCDSKHISKNLEYDEIDILGEKVPCIIMKLYEKTLKNFRNEEPRTADNVIRLFEHLCEALEVIHAKKIIHRDIKPENIFVDGMDFVLADYGLAKYSTEQFELADMSRADERLGNCTYSAPEQIEKPYRAATEASDIYAMAQVIYWYVTGKTFRGIPLQKITDIINEPQRQDVVALENAIMQSLYLEMEKRPQNIQELRKIYNASKNVQNKSPFDDFEIINEAIRSSCPDCYNQFIHMTNIVQIRILINKIRLLLDQLSYDLYFTNGWENNKVHSISMLENDHLLINECEYLIRGIWLHVSDKLYEDLMIFEIDFIPDYIINGEKTCRKLIINGCDEYLGKYSDVGYVPIGDKIEKLSDLEHQYREVGKLKYCNVLIGSIYSSFLHESIEEQIRTELGNAILNVSQVKRFYLDHWQNLYDDVTERL